MVSDATRAAVAEYVAGLSETEWQACHAAIEKQLDAAKAGPPAEWWSYPQELILPLLEQQIEERGVSAEVLVAVTGLWLIWCRAQGYAVWLTPRAATKAFLAASDGSNN